MLGTRAVDTQWSYCTLLSKMVCSGEIEVSCLNRAGRALTVCRRVHLQEAIIEVSGLARDGGGRDLNAGQQSESTVVAVLAQPIRPQKPANRRSNYGAEVDIEATDGICAEPKDHDDAGGLLG